MHLLKRILTAVVLIPVVLLLVLRAPVPVLALVAALVALLAVQELLKLAEAYGIRPFRWPTYIFVGLFFLFLAVNPGTGKPLLSTAIFVYSLGFAGGDGAVRFSHDRNAARRSEHRLPGRHGFGVRLCLRRPAAGIAGADCASSGRARFCCCICCCWCGRETSLPTSWDVRWDVI